MFLTVKKWSILYLLTFLTLIAAFAAIMWQGSAVKAAKTVTLRQEGPLVLVIDPGHGGGDGGAQAEDGSVESDINLAVSLRMGALAEFLGVETVLTREEDVSLSSPGTTTVRQWKASDLQNRAALANSVPGAVLISIHQNSLPGVKSVHGAQVFYNGVTGSDKLAQAIQDGLNAAVNDRPKETKAASGI